MEEKTGRVEAIKQDLKFINNLLAQQGYDSAFPMGKVVAELGGNGVSLKTADIFALEAANKILISLLTSKQVWFLNALIPCCTQLFFGV